MKIVLPSQVVLRAGKTNSLIFLQIGKNNFHIYQATKDNKLRQFSFRLLHRILVTKNELFKFQETDEEACTLCLRPDSTEHTFLHCTVTAAFDSQAISWFNKNMTLISPSPINK